MTLDIIEATLEHKPVLAQLLELYSYDFSEYANLEVGENGLYGYKPLPLYWTEANRYPFLIKVDGVWAGFALIQQGSPCSNEPEIWDVAEFFILKKYRQKGYGATIAKNLWDRFPGTWQIRVLANNKEALAFWQKAISKHIPVPPTQSNQFIEGKQKVILRFKA